MFGLMPKPGPILSDQCRMFANLFMISLDGGGVVVEAGVVGGGGCRRWLKPAWSEERGGLDG